MTQSLRALEPLPRSVHGRVSAPPTGPVSTPLRRRRSASVRWTSDLRAFEPSSPLLTTATSTRSATGLRPAGLFRPRRPQQPRLLPRMAERLAAMFPDFTVETFPERHHFDPPHRVEPERLASSLLGLWRRAEQ